jgi:hypothetical protein
VSGAPYLPLQIVQLVDAELRSRAGGAGVAGSNLVLCSGGRLSKGKFPMKHRSKALGLLTNELWMGSFQSTCTRCPWEDLQLSRAPARPGSNPGPAERHFSSFTVPDVKVGQRKSFGVTARFLRMDILSVLALRIFA